MAETLTYEDTTEATSVENLNSDEQDSLQIGEAMQAEQQNLLAGKYKDAQELEKAYVELEKKLGGKSESNPEPEEDSQEPPEAEAKDESKEDDSKSNILDDLWDQASANDFKQETLDQLKGMDPAQLANMHLQYRQANADRDLTAADVEQLQGLVGGKENYDNMMTWATANLNKQEVEMYDKVMERGEPLSAYFAVRALAYRYNDAIGFDGKMLTGTAPKTSTDIYRSQAEVVSAMSDPRYDKDPAYRQDVMQKLQRSPDVKF